MLNLQMVSVSSFFPPSFAPDEENIAANETCDGAVSTDAQCSTCIGIHLSLPTKGDVKTATGGKVAIGGQGCH